MTSIIICLLYPKLFEKKGRNKKSYLDANRSKYDYFIYQNLISEFFSIGIQFLF